jgi:succinate-semialdehyde dehydrogenase/glutarate-semialdehyde dehydrogenase
MGEACTAANRFLVHADVADEFAQGLTARMRAEVVGRGTEDGVTVGPLIDEGQRRTVDDLVADATSRGAEVLTGGGATGDVGYFYAPTVLTDVPVDAEILREEIFGPVAPITTFRSTEEAVARANDTQYGLAAYVYTKDLDRTIAVGEALEFGMVGINTGIVSNPAAPFGGIKHSGFGREGGVEGIDEYLSVKYLGLAQ